MDIGFIIVLKWVGLRCPNGIIEYFGKKGEHVSKVPANWGPVLVRRFSASDGTLISASPAI